MKTNQLTKLALLTTIALIIFVIELQLPLPIAIPGIKLGLANIVTVYAMFHLGPKDTLFILIGRVLLGGIFSGRITSLLYSFIGGLCCYVVMALTRKIFNKKQIWICSILGSISHVIGQMAVAIILTGTFEIIGYLPILILGSIVTGSIIGTLAQLMLEKMPKK